MNIKELALKHGLMRNGDYCFPSLEDLADLVKEALAARDAEAVPDEYQYQSTDGRWKSFMDEQHYDNTVADGSWNIRALFAHPAQVADVVPVAWEWRINHANGGYTRHLCTDEIEAKGYDDSYMMTGEITPLFTHAPTPVAVPEWQPIATAPKDGTIVILSGEFDYPGDWRIKMGYWADYENDWHLFGGSWKPTYWMPLPQAPKEES